MSEQALTPEQVAAALQVEVTTVQRWLRLGKLEGFKLPGGDWRIWPEAVRNVGQQKPEQEEAVRP